MNYGYIRISTDKQTTENQHFEILKFASSKADLLEGLRKKDFEKIAEGHNGKSWRTVNPEYAENLESFYNEYEQQNKS